MPHFYQFYKDFDKNKKRLNIKKATRNLEIPQLIIHGNKDTTVLIKEAESLHKWNSKSIFKVIENADHVFNVSHPWEEEELSKELQRVSNICVDFCS